MLVLVGEEKWKRMDGDRNTYWKGSEAGGASAARIQWRGAVRINLIRRV
jgi:hypothetical protein